MVELLPSKQKVAGSSPVLRFSNFTTKHETWGTREIIFFLFKETKNNVLNCYFKIEHYLK
jgi:hypothetical protein